MAVEPDARVVHSPRPDRAARPSLSRCRLPVVAVVVAPCRQCAVLRGAAARCAAVAVLCAFVPPMKPAARAVRAECLECICLAPAHRSLDTQSSSSLTGTAVPRGDGWPRPARSVACLARTHDSLEVRLTIAARPSGPGSAGGPAVVSKLQETSCYFMELRPGIALNSAACYSELFRQGQGGSE